MKPTIEKEIPIPDHFTTAKAVTDDNLEALRADYDRDGYLIVDLGFEPDLIDQCAAITKSYHGKYTRVQDAYRREKPVRQLGAHPAILKLLGALYGRRAFPFQTLNFPVGTQQDTHADTIFFDSSPPHFMCGVWVALEDITPNCGPLHFFAGSHTLPVATEADFEAKSSGNPYIYFAKAEEDFEKRLGVIRKGHTLIWASNLLHGGSAINDPAVTRLSQVTHYYFENCTYTAPNVPDENGAPQIRLPYDFSQGKFVYGRDENGKRVQPHWKQHIVSRADHARRKQIKL